MFYRFARALCLVALLLRGLRVWGKENVPPAGGLIVVSNHMSYWDPVVLGCAVKRRIFFLAKAELFSIPVFKTVLAGLGAFPVRRGGVDAGAFKKALRYLSRGEIVGIFPEGTRSHTGELLAPHTGVAMLALSARVPVLPVALVGTRGVLGRVKVMIGEPLDFSDVKKNKAQYAVLSAAIMKEISRLKDKLMA